MCAVGLGGVYGLRSRIHWLDTFDRTNGSSKFVKDPEFIRQVERKRNNILHVVIDNICLFPSELLTVVIYRFRWHHCLMQQ